MTNEFFGEVISTYSRSEALADGELIDVTKTAKEAGIKIPTAVSKAVWGYMIDNEDKPDEKQIDIKTWDVCFMLSFAIRISKNNSNILKYPITRISNGKTEDVILKAIIGPGDDPNPVMTILMPDED